jgi:cobalt/nickel transport system permease protein
MAHIHLEDGAFTLFWVFVWFAVAAGIISLALHRLGRGQITTQKLAIASMCVAVGFAAFQIEIPVFGGIHLNLTPLMGILVGPALGSLCVLTINIFSAAIGHGGWSMIGANTLVNTVEVFIGFYGYRVLRRYANVGRFYSGFGATATALTVSALVAVAIVSVSLIQGSTQTRAETMANMTVLAIGNIVMGVFEGIVTGYIVSFLGKVRPDLIGEPIPVRPEYTENRPEAATNVQ